VNKCPSCGTNIRRVRGSETAVFCPECGWTYKNGDKKFRALGRPPKPEEKEKKDG